ncbi:unnamed protein product, partial [Brenthis ino]
MMSVDTKHNLGGDRKPQLSKSLRKQSWWPRFGTTIYNLANPRTVTTQVHIPFSISTQGSDSANSIYNDQPWIQRRLTKSFARL